MGKVVAKKSFVVSTDMGTVETTISEIDGYDIEDMMRQKAQSQARLVQWVVFGKTLDINSPVGPNTLKSVFFQNDEELLT